MGTAPRPRTEEPEHHWSDLLFATVWLVFLVIPAAALLQSDEPIWARALGLLGLALFAGLYTVSWIRQILLPYLSVLGNAVLWCAVLLVPLTLLLPAPPHGAWPTRHRSSWPCARSDCPCARASWPRS